jgi:hypothetical protein
VDESEPVDGDGSTLCGWQPRDMTTRSPLRLSSACFEETSRTVVLPERPPRAASPGTLPAAGPLRLASVRLPPGRPVNPRTGRGALRPALWTTDEPVDSAAAAWAALAEQFPDTGLWPVLLRSLGDDSGRPWNGEDLYPVAESAIDAHDPGKVLDDAWHGWLVPIRNPWPAGTGPLAPFGPSFPGLAPQLASMDVDPLVAAAGGASRLGLVSCRRPADALALAGWTGTVNRIEPVEVSAVLRSWEDRFGAVLVGLAFSTITLLVTRPPVSQDDALRVAAEVAALCPDALWQPDSYETPTQRECTLAAIAQEVVRERVWRLWFD